MGQADKFDRFAFRLIDKLKSVYSGATAERLATARYDAREESDGEPPILRRRTGEPLRGSPLSNYQKFSDIPINVYYPLFSNTAFFNGINFFLFMS